MTGQVDAYVDAYHALKSKIQDCKVVFHPDTENTFAAYQVLLPDGFNIWLNARNGCIISAGRTINRL